MKRFAKLFVVVLATAGTLAAASTRAPHWNKVREALSKGLPKTALTPMDSIIASAQRDHAWAEAVRAITLRIALEAAVQGNKPEEKILRMRAAIEKAPPQMRPIMEAILADWYWQYFQQNRWRFMQRTATASEPGADFTTWDLPRLFAEIDRHFEAALAAAPILRRIPIAQYDSLFAPATAPDAYRPTLYDFVAFEALEFYGSGEQAGARPEDAFVVQAESPVFAPREEFVRWSITATDTASPVLKGLRLYQQLLRFHASDRNPTARIDADLWRLEFAHAHAVGPDRDARYAAALERIISRDGAHELSSRAIHLLASLRHEQGNLPEAHRLAVRGRDRFPDSVGGKRCFNLVVQIEAKSLNVTMLENVWNSPWPTLEVGYRNLEQVWFRLVPYDFEGELRNPRGRNYYDYGPNAEDIDSLLKRTPVREWSVTMPGTPDYRERKERVPVPRRIRPGSYYLISSARADFRGDQNTISAAPLWVSDLSLVLRDGRPGGLEGFVLRAGSGAPVAGAEIRTWLRKERWDGVEPGVVVRTDRNGQFRISNTDRTIAMLATAGTQRLGHRNDFPNFRRETIDKEERTMFFTDRGIYRPGQVIQYKGLSVLFDRERDDYRTLAARAVRVALFDPNGREVASEEHLTNSRGSFSGRFTAPEDGLRGGMRIAVTSGPAGASYLRVEEYKRPKFLVTLEAPREAPRLAGRVEMSGRALGYTGAPVDGAQVEWRVMREVRYPYWWGWRFGRWANPVGGAQAIARGSATTDAEGRFTVSFTALPDSAVPAEHEPTFHFTATGDVTDGAGETRSASFTVQVGYTALSASVGAPSWLEAGKAIDLSVRTTTLDGVGQAAAGTLTILRLQAPERITRAAEAATEYVESAPGAYVRRTGKHIAVSPPASDAGSPESWPDGEEISTDDVRTDTLGFAKVTTKLPAGLYRARFETKDRFGKRVTAIYPLRVVDPGAERFPLRLRDLFVARDGSVEPGGEFLALWGTGYDSARVFVEVEQRGRMLQAFWTDARRTQVAIRQKVDEGMRGGFVVRVTRFAENRAYLHEQTIAVPWSDRVLDMRWEHFTSKLMPGQKETWTAVVSGPDSARASAEVVATLYDASLDAFAPLGWSGLWGFRYSQDRRGPRSFVMSQALVHVLGGWSYPTRDGTLTYRSVPWGLLWGDYTYGFNENQYYHQRGGAKSESRALELRLPAAKGIDSNSRLSQLVASPSAAAADAIGRTEADEAPSRADLKNLAKDREGTGVSGGGPNLDVVAARSDMRETAFFLPHLVTNEQGEVRIEFTMPEALTEWRFLAFAHDNALRSGMLSGRAVTSKDLMVQPNPPRFLREGDEVEFTVKVTNRAETAQRGKVRLEFFDAGDDAPANARLGNRTPELALDLPALASRSFSWRIRVPDGAGVLRYKAVAATAKLSDGEEGFLPVLSRRILVIESLPLPIRGPATKTFDFDRLLKSGESATLQHQSLTVQMVSNPSWYAVMALPYLIEYPYECSEQTFNRLYANTLARHIANSDPRIRATFDRWRGTAALDSPLEKNPELKSVLVSETPWLRQAKAESQARRNVGILFERGRLDRETRRLVDKLERMQLPGGLWPWFPGGPPNEYISLYITTGFGRLRHLGVDVPVGSAVRSLRALDAEADRWYRDILRCCDPNSNHLTPQVALWLYGRSFFLKDQPVAPEHKEALEYWLGQAHKHWLKVSDRQTRGHLALALMRWDDPATAKAIMRSVKEYSVTNEEMGMFWRDTEYSWWWYRAPIETQALMIEAFDEVMGDLPAVEECRVWLLKQKQTQDWKTTKATADAVYALLLRGSDVLASDALVEVALGDSLVRPGKVEPGTGFYEKTFRAGSIRPGMGHVKVAKSDPGVAWGSVHWQYLEDMDKVTAYAGTPLKLEKQLFVRKAGKAGLELHPVEGAVHVGDELIVRVVLRTDRDMEYVHLKDYRGSGVEPVNVLSQYKYQDGLRYYEETRDVASHFFIDYLPKGTYVFEYAVRVQLRGKYTSGVAEIQCMYAPEFNSHSGSVAMVVE